MTNKIYLIHCWDGTKDDGWYPWLDKKISDSDNQFIRLNMPDSANPQIEKWVGELEKNRRDRRAYLFRWV